MKNKPYVGRVFKMSVRKDFRWKEDKEWYGHCGPATKVVPPTAMIVDEDNHHVCVIGLKEKRIWFKRFFLGEEITPGQESCGQDRVFRITVQGGHKMYFEDYEEAKNSSDKCYAFDEFVSGTWISCK